MTKKLWLLSILLLFIIIAFGQDSTAYQGKAGITDVADEDPGLFIVMMMILVALITSVILGLVAISILFVSLTALVTGGIVSFSIIMGLYHKSLQTGIRTLIYTVAILLGGGAGLVGYFLFNLLRHVHFQINYPLLLSIACGMAGGFIVGALAIRFINILYTRLKPNAR
jgi:phosphate/sulfate permease